MVTKYDNRLREVDVMKQSKLDSTKQNERKWIQLRSQDSGHTRAFETYKILWTTEVLIIRSTLSVLVAFMSKVPRGIYHLTII